MTKLNFKYTVFFFVAVFLLLLFTGCAFFNTEQKDGVDTEIKYEKEVLSNSCEDEAKSEGVMRIKVSSENAEVIFELNDSSVSKSFYEQLPLTVSVKNYGKNEKVFELSQNLDVSNVLEKSCPAGSIAYFSPWNNIAMYYGDAPKYKGLYFMGTAVDGADKIGELTGLITITAYAEGPAPEAF